MLEKFLVLLERFVVAHELIAANSAKEPVIGSPEHFAEFCKLQGVSVKEALTKPSKELPVEGEKVIDTKPAEEEKSKRKPGKSKPATKPVEDPTPEPEEEKEEVDYQSLRDQIQAIDDAISEGPSNKACADADDLLEEFTGKHFQLAKIKDEDLAEYLERLTAIKNKYFEEE